MWSRGWSRSTKCARSNPAKLYLPHFGLVADAIPAHFDALEERVRRWSNWFRDEMRAGREEKQLVPAFAAYEANDLQAGGAAAEECIDYEAADPSHMAVSGCAPLLEQVSS